MQTQETTVKNPSPKKYKAKDLKTALLYIDTAKHLEQGKKDKKMKIKKLRRDYNSKWIETLGTRINTIHASKKDLRKKHDTNKVACYNYNKKDHYASTCTKTLKNKY